MSAPGPARLLYIDDDAGLARLVRRTAEARGLAFEHAESAEAGLARLAQGGIDVVALDHHMPGGLGLDALPAIRALPDAPPVIYVTGSDESRVAVSALKAGAVDYVWKDVAGHFRELLVEAVETALRQEALRRAKEEADEEVRLARDRAMLLLQEVNHRVANSLALVAALARMQANAVADPAAKDALEEMQVRISAIAGVHRRLYTSADVQTVELDAYLASLVEELQASMSASGRSHSIELSADPLAVSTDRAVSFGVIVTELVTNAFKYAYADGAPGPIRVTLSRRGADATLVVEDEGGGYDGTGKARGSGLGTRIMRAMSQNLAATLAYETAAKGTRAVLRFAA